MVVDCWGPFYKLNGDLAISTAAGGLEATSLVLEKKGDGTLVSVALKTSFYFIFSVNRRALQKYRK